MQATLEKLRFAPSNRASVKRSHWDARRHTLWLGRRVLKHFKHQAPSEEAVLAAFEGQDWRPVIEAGALERSLFKTKAKLRDTIRNLNRSVRPWLHFFQEGSGTRIGWEAGDGE